MPEPRKSIQGTSVEGGEDIQELNREPKEDVKRILRREVGFSCPVLRTNGKPCGCPYLTWHHFNPPWEIMKHHNPEGMIALCSTHHTLADGGRYTNDELRSFKANAEKRAIELNREDTLGWMRQDLLTVMGGNFYYKSPILLQYDGKPVIWFKRDEQEYLLLNIDLLPLTSQKRLSMRNNDWGVDIGKPTDFKCPPHGKKIEARYDNGDKFGLQFVEITSEIHFRRRYDYIKKKSQSSIEKTMRNRPKPLGIGTWDFPSFDPFSIVSRFITFPITTVELYLSIKEANLRCNPDATNVRGNTISCNFEYGGFLNITPDQISL
jgi:hypothetical protein